MGAGAAVGGDVEGGLADVFAGAVVVVGGLGAACWAGGGQCPVVQGWGEGEGVDVLGPSGDGVGVVVDCGGVLGTPFEFG